MAEQQIALFERIQAHLDEEEWDEAIDLCDEILVDGFDEDIFRVKVYALVQDDQIKTCLRFLDSQPREVRDLVAEEYHYCLFRHKEYSKLNEAFEAMSEESSFDHMLHSQSLYKAGDGLAALDHLTSSEALKPLTGSEAKEAVANRAAMLVLGRAAAADLQAVQGLADSTLFEAVFNHAVGLLGAGDLPAAFSRLTEAMDLAKETLGAEGYSAEEVDAETFPIAAGQAVVRHAALVGGVNLDGQTPAEIVAGIADSYRQAIFYGSGAAADVAKANSKSLRQLRKRYLPTRGRSKSRRNPRPKTFDPAATPDPKRWMPRWMREAQRNKDGVGAQGVVGDRVEIQTMKRDDAKMRQAMRASKTRKAPRRRT